MQLFRRKASRRGGNADRSLAYMVKDLNRIREANAQLAKTSGARALDASFMPMKRSDTLFILGSGPSINELSARHFDVIAAADSIGFNYWLAHDFVPRFFMFQLPPKDPQPMLDLARLRREDYRDTPFLFRGSNLLSNVDKIEATAGETFSPEAMWLVNEFPIHSQCEINVDELIAFVENLGLFSHGRLPEFLVKWRGTLGLLLSFGWNMGYRRIVLCGIDMTSAAGGSHFYDAPGYDALRKRVNLPHPTASNIHTMMDESHGRNTVGVYVDHLSRFMRRKAGVELMIASTSSALHPMLPLWRASR